MTVRTHNGGWAVFANWLGAERPVYGGRGVSVWACIAWRKENG